MDTEQIFLRELQESDWEAVHLYASQEKVCHYQPWGPNSEKDTKEYVRLAMHDAARKPRVRYVFAAIHNERNLLIGAGELFLVDQDNHVGEIGYIVNPEYWGKGIATDIAGLLINFGFQQLNLHRIYATCDPRNVASAKVLEKTGMRHEGLMREVLLLKDGWRDSSIYSILSHEW